MSSTVEDKLRQSILAIRALREQVEQLRADRKPPVAVVGMACRLPGGAVCPQDLWELLCEGRDAVTDVPPQRWDVARWYDPDPDTPGKSTARRGAFLDQVDQFDAGFFEIAGREAAAMDPQQRLLLECAWEALEDGCLVPTGTLARRTGVYVGINGSDYHQMAMRAPQTLDAYALSGTVASVAAGRIAYALGLQGPALAIDTACSSSLTAVHLAVQALRAGEIDAALVGGVYTMLEPHLTVALSKFRMLATDGRCKTFDAAADGFVQGEGCVMLLLQRGPDARRAGRPVHAVIRGSAANQDGRTSSLTAPSGSAQAAVVRAALDDAGVAPAQVGLVETHGTGTALGDPIEFDALAQALAGTRPAPVALGALKTNLGHLGPAAGIAGLLKAVLAVREGLIPPNLHLQRLNPAIELGRLDCLLPDRLSPWPDLPGPRTGDVSSFGFSGTNVHVLVQQWPASAEAAPAGHHPPDTPVVLAVSGRTAAACEAARERMLGSLRDGAPLAAMARTSLLGRRQFEHRLAVVAATPAQARAALTRAGAPVRTLAQAQPGLLWVGPVAAAGRAALLAAWDALAAAHEALSEAGLAAPLHAGQGVGAWAAVAAAGLADWTSLRVALADSLTQAGAPLRLPAPLETAASPGLVLPDGGVAHRLDDRVSALLAQALADAAPTGSDAAPTRSDAAPTGAPAAKGLPDQGATLLLTVEAGAAALPEQACGLPQLRWTLPAGGLDRGGLLNCLAALHRHGVTLAWERVLPPGPLARLPLYPFQRRRHWRETPAEVPTIDAPAAPDAPAARTVPSGLLAPPWLPGTRAEAGRYLLQLGLATAPWLADHRVHGRVVVPGALQLLWLAAAWQQRQGGTACRLRNLTFGRPLVLPEDGTLALQLVMDADGSARIEDAGGAGLAYASAMADAAPPSRTGPAALDRRSDTTGDAAGPSDSSAALPLADWRARLAAMGIAIGPAFQGLVRLHCAPGRADGEVVSPALLQQTGGWHPARLDACLQVAGGALSASERDGGALLPVGIDEVVLRPPGPDPLRVRASGSWQGDLFSSDIEAFDPEGNACLQLRGLHVRRAPAEGFAQAMPTAPLALHTLDWVPAASRAAADTAPAPAPVLVVLPPGADAVFGAGWITALERAGSAARVVSDARALADALRAGPPVASVVALALAAGPDADADAAVAGRELATWLAALATQLDTLDAPPRLVLLTQQAWGATSRPSQAAAWGMALTIGVEAARLQPVCIDVDEPSALQAEWAAGLPDEWVAWAQGRRSVPKLAPLHATAASVRLRGTALVTGAFGGIGLHLVRWAASRGAQHLLLAARRAPDAQVQAMLDGLGVPCTVWLGDLAQPGAVRQLLQAAPQPPRTVLHAAGAQAPGVLARLTPQQMAAAWEAKVSVAWDLHRLVGAPDAFVSCSSLASLLGAPGQGGYAAANASLDALARHRRAQGLPATSVLWGAWDGAGMLAGVDADRRRRIETLGVRPMAPQRALDALDRAIASGLPEVVVADADWTALSQRQRPGRPLPWLAGTDAAARAVPATDTTARAAPATDATALAAPATLRSDTATAPLDWLLAALRDVLQVAPAESLDADLGLVRMGLDSLMAVELRARIQRERGVPLSIAPLLSGASAREVAALLQAPPADEWEEITL